MSGSDPLSAGLPVVYSRSLGAPTLPRRLSGASQTSNNETNQHPLLSSTPTDSTGATNKYVVYSSKRDSRTNHITIDLELNQPPPPPLLTTLPTAPSSPPKPSSILSRPTTLTTTSTNSISRSETSSSLPPPPRRAMSEASVSLVGQNLKAELQKLELNNDSCGATMVNKLANLGREPEWRGIFAAIGSGKVNIEF